jgi:hypothetical protein
LASRGAGRLSGLSAQIFQPFVFNELNPAEIACFVPFRIVFATLAIESGAFATRIDSF